MKIKLDENIPTRLVDSLAGLGHDVETVKQEGLAGNPDDRIWAVAQEELRFLITQDLDFSDIRKFEPGTHTGILLMRFPDPGREALFHRIRHLFLTEKVEEWRKCLVVATPGKIRVRSPDK